MQGQGTFICYLACSINSNAFGGAKCKSREFYVSLERINLNLSDFGGASFTCSQIAYIFMHLEEQIARAGYTYLYASSTCPLCCKGR